MAIIGYLIIEAIGIVDWIVQHALDPSYAYEDYYNVLWMCLSMLQLVLLSIFFFTIYGYLKEE
ncbi:hypothetical protein [Coraliomargarita akajimensis]|nr:hypothetical protein [Coraliomargarita akajimensis]